MSFITGGFWPCFIRHYGGDDDEPVNGSYIQLTAQSTRKPAQGGTAKTARSGVYPEKDLRNTTSVSAGAWHHFAVSWTTDEKRGWLSEIYIDGQTRAPVDALRHRPRPLPRNAARQICPAQTVAN